MIWANIKYVALQVLGGAIISIPVVLANAGYYWIALVVQIALFTKFVRKLRFMI